MGKALKILVADDDAAIHDTLKHIISGLGHSCDLASDGKECLKKIAHQVYDVLFLDLIMPKLDGVGVLQALRSRELKPEVVVISSEDDEIVINEILHQGATAYIVKPISMDAVEGVIWQLAEKKNHSKHQ